jgi:hypothetical protein
MLLMMMVMVVVVVWVLTLCRVVGGCLLFRETYCVSSGMKLETVCFSEMLNSA